MSGGTLARRARPEAAAAVEILAVAGWIVSYLWGWRGSFPGHFPVCVAVVLGVASWSHLRRGETGRQLGFRTDNAGPAARLVLLVAAPAGAGILLAGILLESLHPSGLLAGGVRLLGYLAWGTLQQYLLLGFLYRRFGEFAPSARGRTAATCVLFALMHLPNPFLSWVALGAGVAACFLYRRAPNLWILGAAHGVLGFLMAQALPETLTRGMRVGPAVIRFFFDRL